MAILAPSALVAWLREPSLPSSVRDGSRHVLFAMARTHSTFPGLHSSLRDTNDKIPVSLQHNALYEVQSVAQRAGGGKPPRAAARWPKLTQTPATRQ
jgi:hypothetical protein